MNFIYFTHNNNCFYNSHDFFNYFQAGFGGQPGLIDRTNTINQFSNKNIISLYPFKYNKCNKSLFEIIDNRSLEIINKNKNVHVMWSGGIDSTTALTSLLKNSTEKWQKKHLFIIYNDHTLNENLYIFKKLKCNKIYIDSNFILSKYNKIYKDEIVVTGEMADQIMGSHFCFLYPEQALKYYKDSLQFYQQNNLKFNDVKNVSFDINKVIEVCELLEKVCPYKIYTLYDLLTWINVDLTWDFNCNRYLSEKIKLENLYNFFNTQDFQDWGIENHERKIHDLQNNLYKVEFRKYIDSYFQDRYSYQMKKKTSPSTSSSITNTKDIIIGITQDFKFYYNNKIDKLICNNKLKRV